jgi:hypothetical protein
MLRDSHIAVTAAPVQTTAIKYREWLSKRRALWYASAEAINPAIQIKKPLANGAAKRWQG